MLESLEWGSAWGGEGGGERDERVDYERLADLWIVERQLLPKLPVLIERTLAHIWLVSPTWVARGLAVSFRRRLVGRIWGVC